MNLDGDRVLAAAMAWRAGASLEERRQWWAAAIPLVPWLPIDAMCAVTFALGLPAPIWADRRPGPADRGAAVAESGAPA